MVKESLSDHVSQFLVEEIYGHHKLKSSCCDKVCLGENEELLPTAFLLSSKKQGIKGKDRGLFMFIHIGSSCSCHNIYNKNAYNNATLI